MRRRSNWGTGFFGFFGGHSLRLVMEPIQNPLCFLFTRDNFRDRSPYRPDLVNSLFLEFRRMFSGLFNFEEHGQPVLNAQEVGNARRLHRAAGDLESPET
jgi:hypothetical protein